MRLVKISGFLKAKKYHRQRPLIGYYMVCHSGVWTRILETGATGYIGIGQASPKAPLHVGGEVVIGLTTGVECSPDLAGAVRFDDTEGKMELCDGSAWGAVGGRSRA